MNQKQFFCSLGALVLAACGGGSIDPGNDTGTGGSNSPTAGSTSVGQGGKTGGGSNGGSTSPGAGTTSTGSGGTSSTAGSTGSGGVAGDPSTCVPGIPTSTQIPRMLNRQYDNVIRDLFGITTLSSGKKPSDLLNADFDGNMLPDAWRLYQDAAATIAHEVMGGSAKSKFISCDPAATDCLKTTIQTFGRKAFRRKLTDAEVARFQKLSMTTPAGTPAEVAETTLTAFLESPSFILIPELNATKDSASGAISLSSTEVAARLSFFLWGSIPDDTLNTAADNNMLTSKDQILTQAKRMVGVKDKTGPLVAAFHRDWVQMNNSGAHWFHIDHDTSKFPLYNNDAKAVYQSEIDNFFQDVVFGNGTFKDIFLSNVAFVNKDNAAIYGLDPSGYTADLKRVTLDSAQRPGFMTRVGFLSSYSHYADTSPILRGAFIMVYLLGVNPGPPIDGALQKQVPPGNYMTNRERMDALVNQDASCQGCHVRILNPPGYALENYDSIGKWQTTDQLGGAINATATVMFSSSNSKEISSPLQLMQEIAQTPNNIQTYARNWVSYAFGRPANANDQCTVDSLNKSLVKSDYTLINVLSDLTQADSFRLRAQETP